MKRATPKRRRSIEIYFVLYIAALVMLLPSKNAPNSHNASKNWEELFRQSFALLPEKTVLNCRLIADSSGNRIVSIDSSNLIAWTGNVKDVQYECTVEDQLLHQKLTLVSNQPTANLLFRLNELQNRRALEFRWHPPEHDRMNRSFIVRIKATASPKPLLPNDSLQRMIDAAGARITAEAQFSVNIIFENSGQFSSQPIASLPGFQPTSSGSPILQPGTLSQQLPQGQLGEFSLQPQNTVIKSMAYQQWSNRIFLSGTTISELRTPSIKIDPSKSDGGTATITEMRGNEIILGGITPDAGLMKVNITAERIADKKEVSVDFIIQPQPLLAPIIEQPMYPAQTYFIQPNLPMLTNMETRAVLRDGKTERVSSQQGAAFTFKPDISDTQKILMFERYVGTKQIGQSIAVHIEPFPPPEILADLVFQNGAVLIRTRSYGVHNDKSNEVRLEIVEGNAASPKDLRGNRQIDSKTLAIIQTFRIVPAITTKQFVFTIRAVDERGRTSALKKIQAE
jgi:hypothetical protein